MRLSTVWVIGMSVCLAGLAGCATGPGGTVFTVSGSAEPLDAAAFGVAEWLRDVSVFSATALVTTYDDDGVARLSTQYLKVRPRAGRISARCYLPGGSWSACVGLDGWGLRNPIGDWVIDHGDVDLNGEQKDRIVQTLRLILHRVRGPLNTLGGGESVIEARRVFAAGYEMTRCRVTGRDEMASAYFYGSAADRLKLVTQGGVEPTEAGAVTVYTNMQTPGGVVLPARLDVSTLGGNSLIGRKKILSVRLTDVKILK